MNHPPQDAFANDSGNVAGDVRKPTLPPGLPPFLAPGGVWRIASTRACVPLNDPRRARAAYWPGHYVVAGAVTGMRSASPQLPLCLW